MPTVGNLPIQQHTLFFQDFEAFFQRRAGEVAHDFLERAPRLPVTAPEIAIEHGFDTAQGDLGVPDRHAGLALFEEFFLHPLVLIRRPGHHADGQGADHQAGAVEEHHGLVELMGEHDAVKIRGR